MEIDYCFNDNDYTYEVDENDVKEMLTNSFVKETIESAEKNNDKLDKITIRYFRKSFQKLANEYELWNNLKEYNKEEIKSYFGQEAYDEYKDSQCYEDEIDSQIDWYNRNRT